MNGWICKRSQTAICETYLKKAKTRKLSELAKTEQNRLAKLNELIDELRLRKNELFESRKNQYNDSIVKIEAIGMQ